MFIGKAELTGALTDAVHTSIWNGFRGPNHDGTLSLVTSFTKKSNYSHGM